jgi:hypothetical protein
MAQPLSSRAFHGPANNADRVPWLPELSASRACRFKIVESGRLEPITEPSSVRRILDHLGEPTRPPRFAPARGPPLWEAATATPPAGNDLRWDEAAQSSPEIEFDQRLTW